MATARRMRTVVAAARQQSVREHETSTAPRDPPARKSGTSYERGTRNSRATALRGGEPYYEQDQDEEVGEVKAFTSQPALVKCGAGVTRNMGNYESLRIDVAVTLPCHPDEVEATYSTAADFVAEKLAEEEALWLGKQTARAASTTKKGR